MMNKIISGKEVSLLREQNKRLPKLVVIIVGENPASMTYVKNKEKACKEIGIESEIIRFAENVKEDELITQIDLLNKEKSVDGILVQLPLPKHINEEKVLNSINPLKDVDGIIYLLESINCNLKGKNVVIVGRSNIVGKPLALLALQKNATVTIAHSKTENLKEVCNKANFFTSDYIKEGAIVIDVGINRDENGLCGDVAFHSKKMDEESQRIYDKVSAITPVPGGVGPMTIAMLLQNTIASYEERQKYYNYL